MKGTILNIFDAICIVLVAVYTSLLFYGEVGVKRSIEKQHFK